MKRLKQISRYIRNKFLLKFNSLRIKRRKRCLIKARKKLVNHTFSLIANNCNGCVLLHELGMRFNSQFVNLFLYADDYIKYLENFDYYNGCKLSFDNTDRGEYPIGILGDIVIHFVHYKTSEEAEKKWEERKARLNKDNMFVMFTEQDDCTPELIRRFDNLSFKNKVVFTHREYADVSSAIYCKEFKNNPLGVYMFFEYKNNFSSKRRYDVFDFVAWFNGENDLKKLIKG